MQPLEFLQLWPYKYITLLSLSDLPSNDQTDLTDFFTPLDDFEYTK